MAWLGEGRSHEIIHASFDRQYWDIVGVKRPPAFVLGRDQIFCHDDNRPVLTFDVEEVEPTLACRGRHGCSGVLLGLERLM
jgi:hypothetical protein